MKNLAAYLLMTLCMGGCVAEEPTASDIATDEQQLSTGTESPAEATAEDAALKDSDEPWTTESVGILASSSCTVGSSGNCTTAIVAANSGSHFIDISINNLLRPTACPYRVRDTVNGVVINSGTVGANSSRAQRLFNVFSQYQLELRGCSVSARGFIDNN
jgi:hypothetical protein